MKKSVKKSAPKKAPKATAKAPRHPLSGWVVFDVTRQQDYEIDFVVDGVAMVMPLDGAYYLAMPLADLRRGDTDHKLFATRKAFNEFLAIHYPDKVKADEAASA